MDAEEQSTDEDEEIIRANPARSKAELLKLAPPTAANSIYNVNNNTAPHYRSCNGNCKPVFSCMERSPLSTLYFPNSCVGEEYDRLLAGVVKWWFPHSRAVPKCGRHNCKHNFDPTTMSVIIVRSKTKKMKNGAEDDDEVFCFETHWKCSCAFSNTISRKSTVLAGKQIHLGEALLVIIALAVGQSDKSIAACMSTRSPNLDAKTEQSRDAESRRAYITLIVRLLAPMLHACTELESMARTETAFRTNVDETPFRARHDTEAIYKSRVTWVAGGVIADKHVLEFGVACVVASDLFEKLLREGRAKLAILPLVEHLPAALGRLLADGLNIYDSLGLLQKCVHYRFVHSLKQYKAADEHGNYVECYWACLKRMLRERFSTLCAADIDALATRLALVVFLFNRSAAIRCRVFSPLFPEWQAASMIPSSDSADAGFFNVRKCRGCDEDHGVHPSAREARVVSVEEEGVRGVDRPAGEARKRSVE